MQLTRPYVLILFWIVNFIGLSAQNVPDISGTWYSNGLSNAVVQISQNGNQLNLNYNQSSSSAYFVNSNKIFAKEWNTSATIASDLQSITWENQVWKRKVTNQVEYPDISGKWYINGDQNSICEISQTGFNLTFTMSNGHADGYYYEKNKMYAKEWSAYGELSADQNTITWNNQTWNRAKVNTQNTARGNHKYCRFELSSFYYASQLLGSAWGRSGTEGVMPTPEAVIAISDHLNTAIKVFSESLYSNFDNCLQYNLTKMERLSANLHGMSSEQIKNELNQITKELESAISTAPFQCDRGVNPLSIYVAGIHLGAAQAWASAQQCMPTPMSPIVASVIANHLTTASNALTPYAACLEGQKSDGGLIPAFNFGNFAAVPLTSLNSIAAHTHIVGTETQLLWAIALSPCCCSCSGPSTNTTTSDPCNTNCDQYCKQHGYQNGRFNGKAPCFLGVVQEGGCDCSH